jgi:phage gp29-like protein
MLDRLHLYLPPKRAPMQQWGPADRPLRREHPDKYLRRAKIPQIRLMSTWTVDDILAAQDAHERGDLQGLCWLWMQRTPRLKSVLRKRVGALSALPFCMLPASGEKSASPEEKAIAKIFEREWPKIMPTALRKGIQRQAIGLGASLCRVHWVEDARGLWWPRLTLWPGDAFYYRDSDCSWYARTREGGDVKVTPGRGWFLFLPDGDLSFQSGSVVSLSIPCAISVMSNTDWMNYNAANAAVVKKVMVPRGATRTQKDLFYDQVDSIGRDNSAVTCEQNLDKSGFDFKYEQPGGTQIDTFERSKADASKEITIEVLGQEKTTDLGKEGARSAVEALQDVEDGIVADDATGLSGAAVVQLIAPTCHYNWGNRDLAPEPKWETEKPKAAKEIAEGDKATAEAVIVMDEALKGSGKKVDRPLYFERAGVTLIDDEQPSPGAPS